jgi:hypothetical protein
MSRKVGSYRGSGTQISGRDAGWFTLGSVRLPPSDAKGLPKISARREGKLLRSAGEVGEPPRLIKRGAKGKPKRKKI